MLMQNKNAVIYGAAGAIGSAVARAFAREGANVFLTGRRPEPLEALAKEIGGQAAVVDALDEAAIEAQLDAMDPVDVSFNAIGLAQQGIQGTPLTTLALDRFTAPIHTYLVSHFLTARTAARHMTKRGSGVILTLTATPARAASALTGGMAPAWAGIEALTRTLAAELGPQGIRVLCLRPDAMPETATIDVVFGQHARGHGVTLKDFEGAAADRTLLKRLPALAEVAEVAAFLASDRASAMTGTVANLSAGSITD